MRDEAAALAAKIEAAAKAKAADELKQLAIIKAQEKAEKAAALLLKIAEENALREEKEAKAQRIEIEKLAQIAIEEAKFKQEEVFLTQDDATKELALAAAVKA